LHGSFYIKNSVIPANTYLYIYIYIYISVYCNKKSYFNAFRNFLSGFGKFDLYEFILASHIH